MDMVRLDHPDKLEGGFKLKQALTFEEVCPVWSEKLRRGLDLQEKYILARDSKYCLVGEAWGFSGRHVGYYIASLIFLVGCWSCLKYGKKFGKIAKNRDSITDDFLPLISEFLEHWNRIHQNITRKYLPKVD
jgi:hypothetical protein